MKTNILANNQDVINVINEVINLAKSCFNEERKCYNCDEVLNFVHALCKEHISGESKGKTYLVHINEWYCKQYDEADFYITLGNASKSATLDHLDHFLALTEENGSYTLVELSI